VKSSRILNGAFTAANLPKRNWKDIILYLEIAKETIKALTSMSYDYGTS